jgi:hypothetical protein
MVRDSHRYHILICLSLSLLLPSARAQDKPGPERVESELTVSGMASYGNYRIFASGTDCKLYTVAVEYNRHTWGYFLKARMDYAADVLPVIILKAPAKSDIWGNPQSTDKQILYGVGISPIGLRMMWRNGKAVRPYYTVKGGILVFNKKALSTEATYENFTLQNGLGLQISLNQRLSLRVGLFNDFHFSNAFIVPVNPGLDVMNSSLGLTYHFQ